MRNRDTTNAHKRNREMKLERMDSYNKHPKLCENCKSPIPYDKRINKYCSHTCAATVTNTYRRKPKFCLYCGKELPNDRNYRELKFCRNDGKCRRFYNFNIRLNGGYSIDPKAARVYYIELRGHKCEKCKLSMWMWEPIFLSLHHKNGDFEDYRPENVELLCGNCHPLTDNFGSKHRGEGRTLRVRTKRKVLLIRKTNSVW